MTDERYYFVKSLYDHFQKFEGNNFNEVLDRICAGINDSMSEETMFIEEFTGQAFKMSWEGFVGKVSFLSAYLSRVAYLPFNTILGTFGLETMTTTSGAYSYLYGNSNRLDVIYSSGEIRLDLDKKRRPKTFNFDISKMFG